MFTLPGKYTTAHITIDHVEPSALAQIVAFINHPAFEGDKIVIMPDVHAGAGVPIGTTILKKNDRIIPNVVGVDIGCGVSAVRLEPEAACAINKLGWEEVDRRIRAVIPTGFDIHSDASRLLNAGVRTFRKTYVDRLREVCSRIGADHGKVIRSVGTLGGGNHFIEIGKSASNGDYYLIVHSGSRNFGLRIAKYHQDKAKRTLSEKHKKEINDKIQEVLGDPSNLGTRNKEINEIKERAVSSVSALPGLEWLEGEACTDYLTDAVIAQGYASQNRSMIASLILKAITGNGDLLAEGRDRTSSVHNFVECCSGGAYIRKGAISAFRGCNVVIPLNMRDGTLLCTGKGNEEWNFSAPHGAGRVLSRMAAKEKLSIDEFKDTMKGISSTSVCESTLDEAPMAYKDSKFIEEAIKPTCRIIDRIVPLYSMKDCKGED